MATWAASPYGVLVGLSLTALGLLLGFVGFGLTLWQIRQVRSVASAQRDAIANLKIRFSHFDVVQECAKAESALTEIRSRLVVKMEEVPLSLYDDLARSFINIKQSENLEEAVSDRIDSAISDINKASEGAHRGKMDRVSLAKQATSMREYHGIIIKIKARIEQEQAI